MAPEPDTDQFVPIDPAFGKVYPAIPESESDELAVRSKPPLDAAGWMKTCVPEPA